MHASFWRSMIIYLWILSTKCVIVLQQVRLHFLRFILESCCSCDNVKIYDGSDSTAPVIRSLCGTVLPADIIASGNTVFIQFVSDHSEIYAGFRIQYSAFVHAEGKIYPVAKLGGHSHVRNYLV